MIYANIEVVLPVGVQEKPEQTDLKIYPNPFTNDINISIDKDNPGNYYLIIFNGEGSIIDKKEISNGVSRIETSHYENGIYLLKIINDKQNILKIDKVIKR